MGRTARPIFIFLDTSAIIFGEIIFETKPRPSRY
jgi:hypothetical protein